MNFVNDVYLITPMRWSKLHAANNFFAHIFHTSMACCVQFINIGVNAICNFLTSLASATRFSIFTRLTQKCLCQQTCCCCFARAARAAKQICMCNIVFVDCIYKRLFHMFLTNNIVKNKWSIFSVKRNCHKFKPSSFYC